MKEMIGCCGLDCEKCDAYIATVNNDDALREKTAKLWSEMNNAPITPEMINCVGCRVDGVKTPYCESLCAIRQCVVAKEKDSCANCPDMEHCKDISYVFDNSEDAKSNLQG